MIRQDPKSGYYIRVFLFLTCLNILGLRKDVFKMAIVIILIIVIEVVNSIIILALRIFLLWRKLLDKNEKTIRDADWLHTCAYYIWVLHLLQGDDAQTFVLMNRPLVKHSWSNPAQKVLKIEDIKDTRNVFVTLMHPEFTNKRYWPVIFIGSFIGQLNIFKWSIVSKKHGLKC